MNEIATASGQVRRDNTLDIVESRALGLCGTWENDELNVDLT